MGCDIHLVVEKRAASSPLGEKWVGVRVIRAYHCQPRTSQKVGYQFPLADSRNYERFAALAGVCGDGPEARGLPVDASDTSRLLFHDEGDHTPSWLPLAEAARIFVQTEGYDLGPEKEFAEKWPCSTYFEINDDKNLDEYRLVFWFDS